MKRTMTPPPPPFYGLGKPVNEPPMTRIDFAIPGRPNWFRRPDGSEYYREPPPNPTAIPAKHTP